MKRNSTRSQLLALALSVAATGCAFEHSTTLAAPSAATAPTAAGTNPATSAGTAAALVGLWDSNALPVLPSPSTCGNFQYQITSQTATSIAGTFTGVCGGGLTLSGTATGQLVGTSVPFTVTGTASMPGIPN